MIKIHKMYFACTIVVCIIYIRFDEIITIVFLETKQNATVMNKKLQEFI